MMKRIFSKALLGALLALVSLQVSAWTSPVPLPDLEAARLRIVGYDGAFVVKFEDGVRK